ncbi:MAG TPA: N-acetyl-gamma-glutamyl-phosphate reductase [Candidatus Omnitrophota bacterium]|nr:N-acetyl-gamma-glutamyl-phosphate reductase [Candidatus Omnitrophota bacterium]
MIKVGILGVSGYSGLILFELLLKHKDVRVTYIAANNTTGKITDIWPHLLGQTNLFCERFDIKKAITLCDVFFLAVPHTTAMKIAPELLKENIKVIDISGDYRLKNASVYKKWYHATHTDIKNLKKAVYGLPELYREKIKKAVLLSNPGCYPTAALLGLAPLTALYGKKISSIIIDAKSGVSGAGRKADLALHFSEVNENFKAYKVLNHQHVPEIELYLSKISQQKISVDFVPHLLPIHRGILETIYVALTDKISLNQIHQTYKRFYKTEKFIRVLDMPKQPELKNVCKTNYCDIGLAMRKDQKLLVITSAIDNLVKGAAGQAVQNMNLMSGFKETEGLL